MNKTDEVFVAVKMKWLFDLFTQMDLKDVGCIDLKVFEKLSAKDMFILAS